MNANHDWIPTSRGRRAVARSRSEAHFRRLQVEAERAIRDAWDGTEDAALALALRFGTLTVGRAIGRGA